MNPNFPVSGFSPHQRIDRLAQARARLRALIEHLPEDGWLGPRAEHLNPPLWEFGHIVWFQERWCLRAQPDGSFAPSLLRDADALYDSSAVAHDSRWSLPLPSPAAVDDYAAEVAAAVSARLYAHPDNLLEYFAELSLYHELMHIEAWWMAFQILGYAPPHPLHVAGYNASPGHVACAAADVELGSRADGGFIFDNEKWQHRVRVPAFDIDTHTVSETGFAAFVDAGGYQTRTLWSEAGWTWRTASDATHPLYWRKADGGWQVRRFADWMPLRAGAPMLHVNRYEAEACAAWLERRLPSAAQWQQATTQSGFSWGACWEWTRDAFTPYPGFTPDPYRDYSQPWFGTHTELRGGGPVTDPLLKRPGFRNFYLPHRRDPFAGFRTVSLGAG
jgi:ergothioneine biosynthesis protein EgtB